MKKLTTAQKDYRYVMRKLWDFFTSKTGAFIIGVAAIAVGTYQFYINKPILEYETEHTNIVSSGNISDLKVTVKEKEYKDMYLTTVTLKNTGSQALDGDDVSKIGHDPIRVQVPDDAHLVSYHIDNKQTSKAVTATLKPYEKDIIIGFDYLNPDNQITVSLLHEKNSDGFKIVGSAVNVNSISPAWTEIQVRELVIVLLVICLSAYILANVISRRR